MAHGDGHDARHAEAACRRWGLWSATRWDASGPGQGARQRGQRSRRRRRTRVAGGGQVRARAEGDLAGTGDQRRRGPRAIAVRDRTPWLMPATDISRRAAQRSRGGHLSAPRLVCPATGGSALSSLPPAGTALSWWCSPRLTRLSRGLRSRSIRCMAQFRRTRPCRDRWCCPNTCTSRCWTRP